ncbi:MAG: DUF3606 domain-containing protein [Burkholderiales bacterium]|nr:DUF3606 domain-containing protein [Burkholderiales bacterium]
MEVTDPGVQRVTLGRERDVERWCAQLRCTEAQLQRALKAVGNSPAQIAAHLQRKYGARSR